MKFWISVIFNKTFLEQLIWICEFMSELMSSPHNFPCILFTERRKSHISAMRNKTCLISTLNKCRIMFALKYCDMGIHVWEEKNENVQHFIYTEYMENCESMRWDHRLTHLHIFILIAQELFRSKLQKFKISYLPNFLSGLHQIFTVLFEMFYFFY